MLTWDILSRGTAAFLFCTTGLCFQPHYHRNFRWIEGRGRRPELTCCIHMKWLVSDLVSNLLTSKTKSMEKLNKGKQESSLNRVCVAFVCLHRDTSWGWETHTLFLSLFLFYSTCSRITKISQISRISTMPNPGENLACHTHINELSEMNGFGDSCVDKHNLLQVLLKMAWWWTQPSSSLFLTGFLMSQATMQKWGRQGDSSCVTPCSPWAVAGVGTPVWAAQADALGLLFCFFRAIDFLPFLIKHSVNWKQLKVNSKDSV